MIDYRKMIWAACLAILLMPQILQAQPFSLDENIRPLELTLRDDTDREGMQWTAAKSSIGKTADFLFVNGISPRRPVEAHLFSIDADNRIKLTVVKDVWNEAGQICETDDLGMCDVKFRTSGDAGFKVSGVEGADWRLLVVTGPEIPLESLMPSPFFEAKRADAARYETSGSGASSAVEPDSPDTSGEEADSSSWFAVAVVVLLAIVAALLVVLNRRRGTVAILAAGPLASLIALVFLALPVGQALAATESDEASLDAEVDALLEEMDERDRERDAAREREEAARKEARKRIEDVSKKVNTALKLLQDAKKLYDTWYGDLSNCATMANPVGAPRIPSFCDGNGQCESCYASARTEFNRVRGVFEQLRIIYSCNKRAIDAAIKFGDGGSAVHGVTALAWQTKKIEIEASVKKLQAAYDKKHGELSGRLHDSMIEISRCEARYGEPDWYDRFGYVYFEFLTDKYKRSN